MNIINKCKMSVFILFSGVGGEFQSPYLVSMFLHSLLPLLF